MLLSRRAAIAILGAGPLLASGRAGAADTGPIRPSYQLYSSRKFGPLARTLEMLARVGYAHVEGGDAHFRDRGAPAQTAGMLAASGLTMPSGHVSIRTLEADSDWVTEASATLGVGTMYCAYLPPDERPSSVSGWVDFGRRLAAAGQPLREAGIGFGWHNHDFEFAPLPDGSMPLTRIFEGGPELEWQADIGWIVRGGADPLRWIAEFGDRITSIHVKDVAPPGQNAAEDGWADVGRGIVAWDAVVPELRNTPTQYYIVEHDNPSDDERFARVSLATLRSI